MRIRNRCSCKAAARLHTYMNRVREDIIQVGMTKMANHVDGLLRNNYTTSRPKHDRPTPQLVWWVGPSNSPETMNLMQIGNRCPTFSSHNSSMPRDQCP